MGSKRTKELTQTKERWRALRKCVGRGADGLCVAVFVWLFPVRPLRVIHRGSVFSNSERRPG
jgi:hypothetical protein